MAKRKKKSSSNNNHNNKRFKTHNGDGNDNSYDASRGYIDASTGQRGAFPGLPKDDESFLGPAHDGLSYLRMVRSEAALVPSLLLSSSIPRPPPPPSPPRRPPPPRNIEVSVDTLDYDDPVPGSTAEQVPLLDSAVDEQVYAEDDYAGYYDDGDNPEYYFAESTYVSLHASPPPPPPPPYHSALIARFRKVRENVHARPPPPTPGIEFPRKFAHKWTMDTVPTLGLLWAMDMQRVLKMVNNVTKMIGIGTRTVRRGVPRRVGEWAWALLVRCESAMGADDVTVVRDMGKMAIDVLKQVKEREKSLCGCEGVPGKEGKVTKDGDGEMTTKSNGTYDNNGYVPVDEVGEDQNRQGIETKDKEECDKKQAEDNTCVEGSSNTAGEMDKEVGELKETKEAGGGKEQLQAEEDEGEIVEGDSLTGATSQKPDIGDGAGAPEEEIDWGYTQATLDMIISVVGDYFGQRDLLEARWLMETSL